MKNLDLINNNFEVIYEEELRALTRSLAPLLLITELHNTANRRLADFINGLITAEEFIGERHAFTADVHRSNITQDIKRKTRGHLRLATYPKFFGDDTSDYEKIWILSFDEVQDHLNYLKSLKGD
jgi:hypothetical protein